MDFKHNPRVLIPILLVALVGLNCACATTHSSVPTNAAGWLEPSPALKRKLDEEAKRVPYTHGIERIELIRWFAGAGEAAFPTLLELAADPRKDVAIAALAAMGATHDSRLVPFLEQVPIPDGPDATDLRLERARTLLRLGDWGAVPTLISGLSDERVFTRALCSQALTEATHENFGFDPKVEPAQSSEAVAKWEAWWKARAQDELLPKPEARAARSSDE